MCDELLEEAELEVPCPLRNNDFSFIILFLFLYVFGVGIVGLAKRQSLTIGLISFKFNSLSLDLFVINKFILFIVATFRMFVSIVVISNRYRCFISI